MNLGETIYRLRTGRGMSQDALAGALDVSRQSVSKWENNAAVPELDKLLKLSEIFGVTLDELVGREAPTPPPPPAPNAQRPPSKPAGHFYLGFGLVMTLLTSILYGFIAGVFVGLPFAIVGSILLSDSKDPFFHALWGVFAVYAPLLYFVMLNFMGFGWGVRIGILVIWFAVLILISLRQHRKGKLSADSKKLMIGCIVVALVLFGLLEIANSILYHNSGLHTSTEEIPISSATTEKP